MSISLKVIGRFASSAFLCVHLPLLAQSVWFEPNRGQVHRSVEFLARSGGGYVYFARNRMAVHDVRMELVGGNRKASVDFIEPTGGISSYFIGRTEKDWHTGIPHYTRVRDRNVYSGIDVVYYANGHNIEYDFVLRPDADPNQIRVAYNKPVRVDENGDLLIAGLRQKRPRVYQNDREIACEYVLGKRSEIRLAFAEYDRSQALTVDPVLEFSTYLGGVAEESGYGLAFDSQGNVYLAGGSQAPATPDLNPFQQTTALIMSPVVFKMTPDGRKILYYAFVGNGGWDQALAIGVDANGSAVITGDTQNTNFPLKNAFQTQFKAIHWNAFVSKLSPDGRSLVYSGYIGGSHREDGYGLALDPQGNAFITGITGSNDFPVKNAIQSSYGGSDDCYAAKVAPNGDLLWSTYLGGSSADWCYSVATDLQGNAYIAAASRSLDFPLKNAIQTAITPRNGWSTPLLIKLGPDGSIAAATFLGGPVAGAAYGIAVDQAGNVYLSGAADSALATKNAFQAHFEGYSSGFLLEIDKALKNVVFATYFGGSGSDNVRRLAVDQFGSIYVTGGTTSVDFPVKGSFQSFIGGGVCQCDAFVAKFAPGGQSLIYSTLMGGHNGDFGEGIAVDSSGNAYVTGITYSDDFPTKKAFQSTYGGGGDFFFAKISDNTPLAPSPLTPNPGRLLFRYIQGGSTPAPQVVAVSGSAFTASASASWLVVNTSGSNVTVSVNPAGLAPNTYNASVSLTPQAATPASIEVTFTVLAPAPVLTSVDPALVPMGSNDTTITVHGSGFTSSSTLLVDGIPWLTTPVQFVDASTLKFSMPAAYFSVQYNHTIVVQNPQSALSNVLSLAVGVQPPTFTAASVVNAASFAGGPVAPGEIVTIFGTNLAGNVTFDYTPATLVYSSATQMSATVPYAVRGPTTSLQVGNSVPVSLDVAQSAPGIFAAVANGDGTLTLYATGCGALTQDALPACQLLVSATVNDESAQVLYAGVAPGLVQGVNQINLVIPDDISSGPLSIVVTAGTASSKPFSFTLP